jgi:putative selenate reductase
MSDQFSRISCSHLLQILLESHRSQKQMLGIPESLFFTPATDDPFRSRRFGHQLGSPLGVAAGPHSQLAQNIIAAWLCGSRYIELKTIQTLDELSISKPCIDMQDEGYNCEWSQELRLTESADEYVKAWVLIHVLYHYLGFDGDPEVIFNMSVGYNMEGLLNENVQQFIRSMLDANELIALKKEELSKLYPAISDIVIPGLISDNVTLSTMHGCPPGEIEKIGLYLIRDKGLHTVIKLNPTLLGPEELREILNKKLWYKTEVPDEAFDHDLKYPDAIHIIRSLSAAAEKKGVFFGLKLTNTLESINNRNVFPAKEKMMYMSGRALHKISVRLALKLQKEFKGQLDISFSAGADFTNVAELIKCGLSPVTVCSDLLKPGGYGRLYQYLQALREAFAEYDASNQLTLICNAAAETDAAKARLLNLEDYNARLDTNEYYRRDPWHVPNIKTTRKLGYFDCIAAPCVDTCPSNQEIPQYMYHASKGETDQGLAVILRTNPFPNVCGMVCDHLCHTRCTRINYDQTLRIREVKRSLAEYAGITSLAAHQYPAAPSVAVIGAGPSGLACAYFLRLAGCKVTVYEAKNLAGGMVSDAIPAFRLSEEAISKDIQQIIALGVEVHYGHKIDSAQFEELKSSYDYLYIAVGAQRARKLAISGEELKGVLDPLRFLSDIRRGKLPDVGKKILVIGGGNTAMDVARTAMRIAGQHAEVSLIYRRTRHEMPADAAEIDAALADGVRLLELTAPLSISEDEGHLIMQCIKMRLSEKDDSGRQRPVPVEGSEFVIQADVIIPAVGQEINIPFMAHTDLPADTASFETSLENIFAGGDAVNGGVSIIRAIADGKKVAEKILHKSGMEAMLNAENKKDITFAELMKKRSLRRFGMKWSEKPYNEKKPFEQITETPGLSAAAEEAERCLYCDEVCNICVTVCPNRANFWYQNQSMQIPLFTVKPLIPERRVEILPAGIMHVEQQVQVANITDFCNECGNCATFCPTAGKPYTDKPRICLTPENFRKEDHAFYFSAQNGRKMLFKRDGENVMSLEFADGCWLFEDDSVQMSLGEKDYGIISVRFYPDAVRLFDTTVVAEMLVLYQGLKDSCLFHRS